jgi:hypothetical protein
MNPIYQKQDKNRLQNGWGHRDRVDCDSPDCHRCGCGRDGIGTDGERPVQQSAVAIWRPTKDRVVTFRIGDGPVHLLRIDYPAKPVETGAMTP